MVKIIEDVVYQHAENVCSLWVQRQNAVNEPHYSFPNLLHLDDRVEANLEGIRVAGDAGLPFLQELLEADDAGACFALALLALETGDNKRLEELFDQAMNKPEYIEELVSAFAWSHPLHLKDIVKSLLTSDDEIANIIALKACAAHNKHIPNYLPLFLNHSSSRVRSATLHAGANIGGIEFSSLLWALGTPDDEAEQFELARAKAFSNKPEMAADPLIRIALSNSPFKIDAVNLTMQLPNVKTSKELLITLDNSVGRSRDVIRGFGLLGDPSAMNWLIDKTETQEFARLAGGSISMITGIDLTHEGIELTNDPEGFYAGPDDDPSNDDVAMDEDEDLPWPDTNLLREWWDNSARLFSDSLYLTGREKVSTELQMVLTEGKQRQRNAAAAALAVRDPASAYYDTQLPTTRQLGWSTGNSAASIDGTG